MREIKFRAWDFDDKKMWKVVTISDSIWGDCEEKHIKVCDFDKSPSAKETDVRICINYDLMQFTGLYDVNGTEIYEGDILEFANGKVRSLEYSVHGEWVLGTMLLANYYDRCKVIGNIHD